MWCRITKALDRLAIRQASAGTPYGKNCAHLHEATELLNHPDFFCEFANEHPEVRFTGQRDFQFDSPLSTPWPANNVVYGRLFGASRYWKARPSVILLHGWNGELGYRFQFPYLAWRLCRAGINAAFIELPYHSQRKPQGAGAMQNFISYDLLRTIEAVRQTVADTRALAGWLLAQGSPCVGLWGFSLGAWLAGLIACSDARVRYSVLLTPVVSLERAITELAFCAPIRESLESNTLPLGHLNLASRSALAGPENVLIVESQHDVFAPAETVEELWRAWRQPDIWRVPHGHISVLLSVPVMERTVKWIARKASNQSANRSSGLPKLPEVQAANPP